MGNDSQNSPNPKQPSNPQSGNGDPPKRVSYVPTRKVGAGAFAGALSTILVWLINSFILTGTTKITPEIASALTTVLTFLVGYFVPEGG
jgi:hypothetical protein